MQLTQQDNEEYLTPDEASTYVGVTRRTLERYVDNKRIKKYRRGIKREIFFKKSELAGLLEIRPDEERE